MVRQVPPQPLPPQPLPPQHFSHPLPKPSTMLQGPHVFSPQLQYNPRGEVSWLQHPPHYQHTQQPAGAAPAFASQHGQYDRIAATHTSTIPSLDANNVAEEYSRTLAFLADLLDEDTREAALVGLSKRREQVPELALLLWHSFGTCLTPIVIASNLSRCYDFPRTRNNVCLHADRPFTTALFYSFEPGLQCARSSAMRCVP